MKDQSPTLYNTPLPLKVFDRSTTLSVIGGLAEVGLQAAMDQCIEGLETEHLSEEEQATP